MEKTDKTFKPLLASPVDLDTLKFPVLASPKLDGIRAVMRSTHKTGQWPTGGLKTRSLKDIPNEFIRDVARRLFPFGYDGELMTYTDGKLDSFSDVSSKVMSKAGEPDFRFHVFDQSDLWNMEFHERLNSIERDFIGLERQGSEVNKYLERVAHEWITDIRGLMDYEERMVKAKWEGIMLRDPKGLYKFGRSTTKEGILLKMKRFHDAEAVVVDMVERQINNNEQFRDELGRAKRSTAKEGKVPAGDLGALVCEYNGVRFELGTGFTASQRVAFWYANRVIGQKVKFKYQELSKDNVPRFPVFLGFRHEDDL